MKRFLSFLFGAITVVVMLFCLASCDFLFGGREDDEYKECEQEYELQYSEATCTHGGDKHLRCVKWDVPKDISALVVITYHQAVRSYRPIIRPSL